MLGSKGIYTTFIVEVPRANDFPEAIVYSFKTFRQMATLVIAFDLIPGRGRRIVVSMPFPQE